MSEKGEQFWKHYERGNLETTKQGMGFGIEFVFNESILCHLPVESSVNLRPLDTLWE